MHAPYSKYGICDLYNSESTERNSHNTMQKKDEQKILSGEMRESHFKRIFKVDERELPDFVAFRKKYNGWLYCVFVTIAVGLILYFYPNTDQDNARYILSAISQGLGLLYLLWCLRLR
jgi:hypothetical protein